MKKLIVPLAIVAMLALLGIAAAWDCVRLLSDASQRVALADAELQKHEQRLIKSISGHEKISPEVQEALAKYQAAADRDARHQAYDELVISFRQTMSGEIDATNPLERKFMDDVAGAINRREIAEKPFDEEQAAYEQFLNTRRGRVARWFF